MPDASRERPSDADLPVDLRQFAPGQPSADFVARTLRAVDRDPEVRFSRALAAHRVPAPSPDFVTRTLAALAADHAAAPAPDTAAPRRIRQFSTVALAAAAMTMVAAVWWLGRGEVPPDRAPAHRTSAASLAHALGELGRPDSGDPAQTFLLAVDFVAVDGSELLATHRR